MKEKIQKFTDNYHYLIPYGFEPILFEKDLNALIKEAQKDEAIYFGKYLANNINTERLDEDDVNEKIPKLYEEYLNQ